jgi:hypothetical protein
MAVSPVRPDDLACKRPRSLPGEVVEAFNEAIASEWDGRKARVSVRDVVRRIGIKTGASDEEVFMMRWLDVEATFAAAGWDVGYGQPYFERAADGDFFEFARAKRQ